MSWLALSEQNNRDRIMNYIRKTRLSILIASALGALVIATPASSAQEDSIEADDVEVIIVSSTRTGTSLADTSAAVTALSAKSLANAGVTDPTNLQDQAIGISIDRAGSNGMQITIRGVSSSDNTEKGDPSASFLQDGVYIARPQAQEVSFFDLDQVEVLRGPQGTLYGRNATAGLINVISARPVDDTYGSFDGVLGDYGRQQATLMMNVALNEKAAIRGAINVDRRDAFINPSPAEQFDTDPDKDNLSFRLSGLFEISDDASLLVVGDHSTIKGLYNNTVSLTNFYDFEGTGIPESGRGQDFVYIGGGKSSDELRTRIWSDLAQESVDNSTWGIMTELNWDVKDNFEITYLGSYREFKREELNRTGFGGVTDTGDIDAGLQEFTGDYKQLSNELRFLYTTDFMNLQGGIYSFKDESAVSFLILNSLQGFAGEFSVFGFPQDPTISKSKAVFAQSTFNITDDVRFTAGARYTKDDKSRQGNTIFHQFRDEPINYTPGPDNNIPDSRNDASVNYSETTWKLGAEYDIEDNILLYGMVSTGYKAGGFNDGCLEGTPNCNSPVTPDFLFYDPETLTAYELGLKMDLENGLRTFISVFEYDYENLQLSTIQNVCGDDCQVTTNAGAASITGLEVESRYFITPNDRLNLAFTWLDAEYTDWQLNRTINLKGESLNRSPEFTAILQYQHIFEFETGADLVLDISTRYSDEYVLFSEPAIANFVQPSFHKTDISLTYNPEDYDWYVQGFVKNIEDEITISNADITRDFPAFSGGEASLQDPRTVGVRFGMTF